MKSVIKTLKQFCTKLVNFSEDANEMMAMTEGLRSFSSEGGMTNFSLRSRVKIRLFSELADKMKTALEDFAVWSDDMRRECPKENERLGRKLRMTYKCFSDLQDDFKKIQDDVKDAVELAAKDGEMSKSAPSNPSEADLQKEDTGMAHKMESTVNGAMPEGTKGDANISGPVESVNNNFSKDEYLKSLFTRIADQFDNFSEKLNDAGDLVEEVTDEVVQDQAADETCPECGKNPCECEDEEGDEVELEGSVLDKPDPEDEDPTEKTDLVKTEDEVTGEEIDPEEGEVEEFCSTNFSESVAQDKTIAPEVHENLKVLTDVAEAIKTGSLEDVNKSFDKLDDLEKKDKNFAAITACALMCFSEICKECGQVIPGTEDKEESGEDKVETSAEDVQTPEGEVTTEEVKTEETPTNEKVDEALDKADEEDEVEPPTDEEIIMNFSQELTTLMDGEFQDPPSKQEGENEAKPDAGDAPSKKEGQENMTDVAPIHPDAVKIAMFSVMDKCDEFLDKKANFADVVAAVNSAKEVMSKAYSTPEECEKQSTKFANFCGDMGLFKATESADDSTAVEAAPTTVNTVEEGNAKLNRVVETLKSKLEDLDLEPTVKSFATKLCDEFSSTKCFSEEDLNAKMTRIDSFSEDLKKISGIEDAGTITEGENSEDAKVKGEVENAVAKNDAAQDAENAKLESLMAPATEAPNTPEETPSDALVMTANFSQNVQSGSYGSRMLAILGIR